MKTKKLFPWMLGFIVLFLFVSPASAGGPMLVASDLETEIRNLPRRCASDPILPLEKRLAELKTIDPGSRERQALKQAVSLIWIFRQTRISSTPPR
jgi:hypothetical protein